MLITSTVARTAAALLAPAATPRTLTTGRVVGSVAALVAVAGVVLARRAATRYGSGGDGRRYAVGALAAGLIGLVGGGWVVAVAKGGPGTGYGVVGGYGALAIGLVATALGGLALLRSRRPAPSTPAREPLS